jgi:hypothetical protein
MPKLPGVNHLRAVKALKKVGFHIDRQGKHIFMSKGSLRVGSAIQWISRENKIRASGEAKFRSTRRGSRKISALSQKVIAGVGPIASAY